MQNGVPEITGTKAGFTLMTCVYSLLKAPSGELKINKNKTTKQTKT